VVTWHACRAARDLRLDSSCQSKLTGKGFPRQPRQLPRRAPQRCLCPTRPWHSPVVPDCHSILVGIPTFLGVSRSRSVRAETRARVPCSRFCAINHPALLENLAVALYCQLSSTCLWVVNGIIGCARVWGGDWSAVILDRRSFGPIRIQFGRFLGCLLLGRPFFLRLL